MTITNYFKQAILAALIGEGAPPAGKRGRMYFESPLRDTPRPLFMALHAADGAEYSPPRQPIAFTVSAREAKSSAVTFPPPSRDVVIDRVYLFDSIVGGNLLFTCEFDDTAPGGARYHMPAGRLSITAS